MTRIQLVSYRKRYMTKAIYNYKRYLFHVPVSLGEKLDPSVDYEVRFCDPYIIMVPKNLKNCEDTIRGLTATQENDSPPHTPLCLKSSHNS